MLKKSQINEYSDPSVSQSTTGHALWCFSGVFFMELRLYSMYSLNVIGNSSEVLNFNQRLSQIRPAYV